MTRLEWHGSTPKAIRMPDFLTSDDPWFRPVQVKLGPDGALWIADFYNPIIGHYEFPLTDPHRDHTHGRIWRIVYRAQSASSLAKVKDDEPTTTKPENAISAQTSHSDQSDKSNTAETKPQSLQVPNLAAINMQEISKYLTSPNLVVRNLATNEIADRIWRTEIVAENSASYSLMRQARTQQKGKRSPREQYAWHLQFRGTISILGKKYGATGITLLLQVFL